jgi:hypothetical protein
MLELAPKFRALFWFGIRQRGGQLRDCDFSALSASTAYNIADRPKAIHGDVTPNQPFHSVRFIKTCIMKPPTPDRTLFFLSLWPELSQLHLRSKPQLLHRIEPS